jgi:hypothetical protein
MVHAPTARRRGDVTDKRPRDLGKLHALLKRGLPDYVMDNVLDVRGGLADQFGVSYQAMYLWFKRDKIPAKRVDTAIRLSADTVMEPPGFKPLTRDDLWPFVGS